MNGRLARLFGAPSSQETAKRMVGPRMRIATYPAQVINQRRMRCLKVNFRQGLSTGGVAGVATALTI